MKLKSLRRLRGKKSVSAFAAELGVHPFQLARWLDKDCQVDKDGVVWCPSATRKPVVLTLKGESDEKN